MAETENIKQKTESSKKQTSGAVASTIAMAGAGLAGGVAGAVVPEVINAVADDEAQQAEAVTPQPEQPVDATPIEPVPEPEPITTEPEPIAPTPEPEPIAPTPEPEPIDPTPAPATPGEHGDVVDNIIAGEEIDPTDIDSPNVVQVDEIGIVSDETGQEYLAAAIHDPEGNQAMMVDVDGDGVFDVITDPEGQQIIAQVPGDIDVSDAEHNMNADGGYLAANAYDESLPETPDMQNDILTT